MAIGQAEKEAETTSEVTAPAISGLAIRAYLDMRLKETDARIDKMKAELDEQLSQWGLRMITIQVTSVALRKL